jgi:predicted nucleic acid-binding Zn ribbon protein
VPGISSLFARWEQLVGPDIAAHARPVGIEDRELIVTTADPAWAAELRWLANDVVARIEARGGPSLVGLRIRVRPHRSSGRRPG